MKFTSPYRQFSAALLLLVYAFIATPVQLWHHHFIQEKNSVNLKSSSTNHKTVVAKSYGSSSHNCQICSHKYSVYNDEYFKAEHNLEITWLDRNANYILFCKETPRFNLSNKDPPVTA